MRTIERTSKFKQDFKHEQRGRHRDTLDAALLAIVELLVIDAELPAAAVDHPLRGEWKDHRDCHLMPDLVLIYRKKGKTALQLVRIGSHSELGL